MDNNFNPKIGDYVETVYEDVGYIISIDANTIEVYFPNNKQDRWSYKSDYNNLKDCFKQIGTYKFNEKISKLENCSDLFKIKIMGNEDWETFDLKAVISKINEIIDYLNKEK